MGVLGVGMMARRLLAWCLLAASSARGAAGAATELFVAPAHGQSGDSALARDGRTRATAFTALHHARDFIRGLPPAQRCRGVTVTVLGGDYSSLFRTIGRKHRLAERRVQVGIGP